MGVKRVARLDVRWFQAFQGIFVAAAVSVLLMFLLALGAKYLTLTDGTIAAVNQIIKVFSILVGSVWALKKGGTGYINGMILGIGYMLFGVGLFTLLGQTFLGWPQTTASLAMGGATGLVCGMLLAGLRKE
jgi:putative membrane protein (TIGR04086 family)